MVFVVAIIQSRLTKISKTKVQSSILFSSFTLFWNCRPGTRPGQHRNTSSRFQTAESRLQWKLATCLVAFVFFEYVFSSGFIHQIGPWWLLKSSWQVLVSLNWSYVVKFDVCLHFFRLYCVRLPRNFPRIWNQIHLNHFG